MDATQLKPFLNSPEAQDLLGRCAVVLQRWMIRNKITGTVSCCDGHEDIVGELVLLILERGALRQEMEEAVVNGNAPALRNLIISAFQSHVLEKRRSSKSSVRHAFYRKTVRLLARQNNLVLKGDRTGSWYAPSEAEEKGTLQIISLPAFNDYGDWPEPAWDLWPSLERKLVEASLEFWKLATYKTGSIGLVAARDFLAWLESKGLLDLQQHVTFLESEMSEDGSFTIEETATVPPITPPEPEALARLAKRIVAAWTPEMAQAFHIIHGLGHTQSKAAEIMGYSSASGVNYHLRQAVLSLREMVSAWPELFGDEESSRDQDMFLEYVLAECKKMTGSGIGL